MLHPKQGTRSPSCSPDTPPRAMRSPGVQGGSLFTLLLAKSFMWMTSSSLLLPSCRVSLWDLRDTFDPPKPAGTLTGRPFQPASCCQPQAGGRHTEHQVSGSQEPPGPPCAPGNGVKRPRHLRVTACPGTVAGKGVWRQECYRVGGPAWDPPAQHVPPELKGFLHSGLRRTGDLATGSRRSP